MIGLDARLATSFTTGLVAAINPCGFVLLPAYLMYFLGMEQGVQRSERASVRRALLVSVAVSTGFLAVFLLIGLIAKYSTSWFVDRASWVALAIGVSLVVLGLAMIFGYRLPLTAPKLDVGQRDRTVRSMFVYGCAYAVASVGCSIPLFLSTVLGGISADGVAVGIGAIAMYGLGMALMVTGLTVALALANSGLLRVLRHGMRWVEPASGVIVLLTGAYLSWYWYHGLRDRLGDDRVIDRALGWQERLSAWVQTHQRAVVTASVVVIVLAIGVAVVRRDGTDREQRASR